MHDTHDAAALNDLFTIREAAARMGEDHRKVAAWIDALQIPTRRIGPSRVIQAESLPRIKEAIDADRNRPRPFGRKPAAQAS